MLVCPVDSATLSHSESAAMARIVDLLQRVPPDAQVPNSEWTAHDVAAHLVTMAGRYLTADRKLASSQRELREMNQREIEEFTSSTMGELIGRLRSRNAKYAAFWNEQPLDLTFPYRVGFPLDAGTLRSNWIAELLIHGRDVATATGEQWRLDATSSLLTLRVLAHVLPHYLTAAGVADLAVSPEGGAAFSIVVKDGAATIQPGAAAGADTLAGSPEALVLLLYGRISFAEAQAMGVDVTGDQGEVQRLLDRLDKP